MAALFYWPSCLVVRLLCQWLQLWPGPADRLFHQLPADSLPDSTQHDQWTSTVSHRLYCNSRRPNYLYLHALYSVYTVRRASLFVFVDVGKKCFKMQRARLQNLLWYSCAGSAVLAVYVNQPPVGGSCTVSPPDGLSLTSLTSMLDGVTVACSGWTDPESQGITSYAINSEINFYLDCLAKNVDIGKIQKVC